VGKISFSIIRIINKMARPINPLENCILREARSTNPIYLFSNVLPTPIPIRRPKTFAELGL
jgi:hypothetical protein